MPDGGEQLRFAIKDFQPGTFAERGVRVAFTSPLLAHARLRIAPSQVRELVLRNPAGGDGWYVGAWSALVETARVSVHDRLLFGRIEKANAVMPLDVRAVSRAVAVEGYAGRHAQDAAREALARDERALHDTYGRLLLTLLARTGQRTRADAIQAARTRAELRALAPSLLQPLEGAIGGDAASIAEWLDRLAADLAPVGLAPNDKAQLANDQADLIAMAAEMEAMGRDDPHCDPEALASVVRVVQAIIRLAEEAAGAIRKEAADPLPLLAAWGKAPLVVRGKLAKLSWLLDGWPALVAAWRMENEKGAQSARRAVHEILLNLPPLPREITGGPIRASEVEAAGAARRSVRAGQDWLAGIAEREQVARNEAVLARAV